MKYIKSIESEFSIDIKELRYHPTVSKKLRSALVKHFLRLSNRFKLKRTTVFLAVYYMDYFFSRNLDIEKSLAISIGEAAIFVAMKYEEIYPPELS